MNNLLINSLQMVLYFSFCVYLVSVASALIDKKKDNAIIGSFLNLHATIFINLIKNLKNRKYNIINLSQYFSITLLIIVTLSLVTYMFLEGVSSPSTMFNGLIITIVVNISYALVLHFHRLNSDIIRYFDNLSFVIFKLLSLQILSFSLHIAYPIINNFLLMIYFLYSVKLSLYYILIERESHEDKSLSVFNNLYLINTILVLSYIYLGSLILIMNNYANLFILSLLFIITLIYFVFKKQNFHLNEKEKKIKIKKIEIRIFGFLVIIRMVLWLMS